MCVTFLWTLDFWFVVADLLLVVGLIYLFMLFSSCWLLVLIVLIDCLYSVISFIFCLFKFFVGWFIVCSLWFTFGVWVGFKLVYFVAAYVGLFWCHCCVWVWINVWFAYWLFLLFWMVWFVIVRCLSVGFCFCLHFGDDCGYLFCDVLGVILLFVLCLACRFYCFWVLLGWWCCFMFAC